jgi:predicted O-methyltransferase YrrM
MTVEGTALVGRLASNLAQRSRFEHSCTSKVGKLLAVLIRTAIKGGLVCEIGTGCGVGTAWMVGALTPESSLVTVELDPATAEAVRGIFVDVSNVRVLTGEFRFASSFPGR